MECLVWVALIVWALLIGFLTALGIDAFTAFILSGLLLFLVGGYINMLRFDS